MAIDIKSFNQILGSMVRKVIAETPLSDVNPGSVFLSLLEACASQDFENNVAILNILELLNVDSTRNNELDNKAADLGLTRYAAVAASGVVTIQNTNIKKQSTSLYNLKSAPISGQTVLFVNSTSGWASSGSLYIGRGTTSFEGPIPYTSITVFATYSQINLGAALQKDHLLSDTIINAQGQPDRVIAAGTVVKIPANNQNPEILYNTLRNAVLPAGEDHVDDIPVLAQIPGSQGNALINTIKQFDTAPFLGAAVTNTTAFSSGTDIETDVELRNRIKSYADSLARGTAPAILDAVIGLSDPDENKRVVSAVLSQPVTIGEPSILYIDDGSGFQPSQAGQAVDVLLSSANGTEQFLQLANYPLARPQVINGAIGPFVFADQMFFRVAVDGTEETVTFTTADFVNIAVATLSEIIAAINARATTFEARLTNDSANALIYPVDPDAEIIQVVPIRASDDPALYANNVLNFPTEPVSYIALFQNSTRLVQRTKTATVETVPFASWNLLSPGDLIISVDGTPSQDGSFTLADFPGVSSFTLLTLDNWVAAVNAKFAGITAISTPGQTMQITSNKSGNLASISILGGSYQPQMFASNVQTSTGQASEFEINRQTGNIKILTPIVAGDTISAGVADARGFVVSAVTSSGTYNLNTDAVGRQSQMVICVDATKCNNIAVNVQLAQSLVISNQGSDIMRIMAPNTSVFDNVQPGHFLYIASRSSWVSAGNAGLFRVMNRGDHLTPGTDTYIEVLNGSTVNETVSVQDIADIIAFDTDVYPQLWTTNYVPSPVSVSLTDLVNSLTTYIQGCAASIFRTNSVKITSTTENNGSIAIPVSSGNIATIVLPTNVVQVNNQPLIASKVPNRDMVGFLKPEPITSRNTYLNRAIYPMVYGNLTAAAGFDVFPYSNPYSEQIQSTGVLTSANVALSDQVVFTAGDNLGMLKSIAAQTAAATIGTQQGVPRTLFTHVAGDEVGVFQSLKISADDNIVVVMDQDATVKTIDINAARTGQVNSGSQSISFIPTSTQFSANDSDNEPGIDFGTVNVWGTTINNTNFSDYRLLMRARNWYASGGTGSSNGKLIVRASEYGPNGNLMRFNIQYPSNPNLTNATSLTDTPSWNLMSYFFGSGADRTVSIPASTTVTITGPYPDKTTNFPGGAASSGKYYDLAFSAGTFSSVLVGDVFSTFNGCGLATPYIGQFGVQNKSGSTIRIYNPSASAGSGTIGNPGLVHIFPLLNTTVTEIVTKINATKEMTAAVVGSGSATITSSTFEDQYTYVSNATALGYGHNPTNSSLQGFVGLYDGVGDIRSFSNSNPNFTTKDVLLLNASGVSSSVYRMDTAPNEDSTTGEYIKLVPSTIKNVKHHLTQKALSQLPIVADVEIADNGKRVQIVSDQLGSAGAVEIIGGQANAAQTAIQGQTQLVSDSTGDYILANIQAFPNTYAVGDILKVENLIGVQRLSNLTANNTISVTALVGNQANYYWNPVTTNFGSSTTITITDVSSSYTDYFGTPLAAGIVWRWTHSALGGENLAQVLPGYQVMAFNLTGWDQGNLAKLPGDGAVSGLPIIKVNDGSNYFDVLCPHGKAMSATAIGAGTVSICPTPRIKWNLAHSAPATVDTLVRASNVVTITTFGPHNLNTGDSIILRDSTIVADGTYGPITVTGSNIFTFANVGSNGGEIAIGQTVIKNTATKTKYRLHKLGLNNIVRLSATGDSPRFTDCGVAVDDYVIIQGKTFNSLNNGTFRVLAVDNTSLTFENPNAVDDVNTLVPFNNTNLTVNWTSSNNTVTGTAGAFKNLSTGVWVKKLEDADSEYVQVTGCDTSNYTTATQIFLGQLYGGISGSAYGVSYDMTTGFNAGTFLKDIDDIVVLDGDAAINGDTLSVQTLTNVSWFSGQNSGTFPIVQIGNDPATYRPFVRVTNPVAVTETNRSLAPSVQGFYITENDLNKFSSYRLVANSVINSTSDLVRNLYMLPDARQYKFSQANTSIVQNVGKFGYDTNVTVGTDGYTFYTGLLRRVQRTVDGYAPDPVTFPERRAVGSRVETLPPLINNLSLILTITTNQGSTIQDISDNVKSAIIDYVNGLGVGDDVILSAIIAKVMTVKGVAAVTFNTPAPTQERITIASNEKALITANNIGIV